MPFIIVPCAYSAEVGKMIGIWFSFSSDLRGNQKFRKRVWNYIFYLIAWNLLGFAELFIDTIFLELTKYLMENDVQIQWLVAFVIPVFRGAFEWILPKFFNKALGYKKGWTKLDEDFPATFAIETQITDLFTLYVAVRLVNADQFTVAVILGVEFCINLFHCFRIIRLLSLSS